MQRNSAMDMGDWRLNKAVGFNRPDDLGADGARDDHWRGGAEAVRHVDLLLLEIHTEAVRAESLRAALEPGIGHQEKAVSVLERGLKPAGGLAAKGEIGHCHTPFDPDSLRLMPVPP